MRCAARNTILLSVWLKISYYNPLFQTVVPRPVALRQYTLQRPNFAFQVAGTRTTRASAPLSRRNWPVVHSAASSSWAIRSTEADKNSPAPMGSGRGSGVTWDLQAEGLDSRLAYVGYSNTQNVYKLPSNRGTRSRSADCSPPWSLRHNGDRQCRLWPRCTSLRRLTRPRPWTPAVATGATPAGPSHRLVGPMAVLEKTYGRRWPCSRQHPAVERGWCCSPSLKTA